MAEELGVTVNFYEGEFLGKYPIIAITLCEETLENKRMKNGLLINEKFFLPENVLRIAYQLVCL